MVTYLNKDSARGKRTNDKQEIANFDNVHLLVSCAVKTSRSKTQAGYDKRNVGN